MIDRIARAAWAAGGVACLLAIMALMPAQAQTLLRVDASGASPAPKSGHLKMGMATSPSGQMFGVNSQHLIRNGAPWLPVMGEFHYTRYPRSYWEEELRKIKAVGVDIVATYVIWNHHEERAGEFNWGGERDLRAFLELCDELDLKALVRIGPWAHGEARFGGSPDWVVAMMPTRRNDPTYLHYVERFWRQIAGQLQGQLWKEGGPVIGVQLENEYNLVGEGRGAEHISRLKALAREIGFDTPYYTVTGWDGAIYPMGEVVPVFAGYPDDPWDISTGMLPPKEVYSFRFDSRVAGNVGTLTTAATGGTWIEDAANTPFLGAELGGGVPSMYRRRPVVTADDIGAMLPVQLGSGVNLYGYYMFHGGRNPQGHTTLEESTGGGGYNDTPVLSYDFQAPLGQYGTQHASMGKIRRVHYFLNEFGPSLATMSVRAPERLSASRADLSTPRFSVRSRGDAGFLFFSNYIRQHTMPPQAGVQFAIKQPRGELVLPQQPVTLPSGAYFIWPLDLPMAGATLRYATAQPLTQLASDGEPVYIFFAQPDIPVEFAFASSSVRGVSSPGARVRSVERNGMTVVSGIEPGTREALRVVDTQGKQVRIVVLTEAQSQQLWLVDVAGQRRAMLTQAQLFPSEGGVTLRSIGEPSFSVGVMPALQQALTANVELRRGRSNGVFQMFEARAASKSVSVDFKPVRQADIVPPILVGGTAKAALQPGAETFSRAAAWSVTVAPGALDSVSDAFLDIDYRGDVGRLFAETAMIDDNYYNGTTWRIGLKRFRDQIARPLTLTVLPLRDDAPIYIEERFRPPASAAGQTAAVSGVRVVPEYELRLTLPVQP